MPKLHVSEELSDIFCSSSCVRDSFSPEDDVDITLVECDELPCMSHIFSISATI